MATTKKHTSRDLEDNFAFVELSEAVGRVEVCQA